MASPPFRTPPNIPEAELSRPLVMPYSREWIGVFSDALSRTTNPYNWFQVEDTDLTPEQAAAEAYTRYVAWLYGVCSSGPPSIAGKRVVRLNPVTYKFEQVSEDGETFETPTDELTVPPQVGRSEPTADERKCAAATNAAYVMHLLYDKALELYEDTIDPAAALDIWGDWSGEIIFEALGSLIGSFSWGVGYIWTTLYGIMEILTYSNWSETFDDKLTCLFRAHATVSGNTVTFDFSEIQKQLWVSGWTATTDILLLGQVSYFLLIIGADGLNLSGETTAKVGQCGSCDTWSYTINTMDIATIVWGTLTAAPALDVWSKSGAGGCWYDFSFTLDTRNSQINRVSYYHQQQSTTTTQRISVSPSSIGTWTYAQNHVGGGPVVMDTGVAVEGRYSNSDTTVVRIWQDKYGATYNSQVNYVTLYGTGRNPFVPYS